MRSYLEKGYTIGQPSALLGTQVYIGIYRPMQSPIIPNDFYWFHLSIRRLRSSHPLTTHIPPILLTLKL